MNFSNTVFGHPTGFPQIGENFENFFQSGKSGENGVFSQNQGKDFQIRELFSEPFSNFLNHLIWGKKLLSGQVLLLGSVSVINWCFCKHLPNGKWRPHLKRINMFFLTEMSWWELRKKNEGKILRNQGKSWKNQGISWDKKVGTLS